VREVILKVLEVFVSQKKTWSATSTLDWWPVLF